MQRKDISISLIVIILLGLAYIVASLVDIPTQAQGGDAPFIVLAEPKVQIISPGEPYVPIQFSITSLINVTDVTIAPQQSVAFTPSFQQSVHLPYLLAYHWFNKTVFFFNVSSQATPGYHNVTLAVTYYVGSNPVPKVAYVSVPVLVLGYSTFVVSATWGTPSSPTIASPGSQDLPLTIVIINNGNSPAYNVTVVAYNTAYITFTKGYSYLGVVPPGTEVQAVLLADVSPSTSQGVYNVPIKIMYDNGLSYTLEVPVAVYGPSLAVNLATYPPQIFQGYEYAQLTLIVTNYGQGMAYNASVAINTPLEVVGQKVINLGAIPPGKPVNVTFLITVPNDTRPGTYPVQFTVKYDGGEYSSTFNVTIKPEAQLRVVGVYGSLTGGASGVPLTIEIENVGNVTAKNLILTLGPNNYIYPHVSSTNPLMGLTASKFFAGDLKPGQAINVTFIVDTASDIPAGKVPVALIAVWNQTGSLYPFEQSMTIYIQISPSFEQLILQPPYVYGLLAVITAIIALLTLVGMRRRKSRS